MYRQFTDADDTKKGNYNGAGVEMAEVNSVEGKRFGQKGARESMEMTEGEGERRGEWGGEEAKSLWTENEAGERWGKTGGWKEMKEDIDDVRR